MEIWSLIGLVVITFVAIRFINALGKTLPIMELMLLISGLQWIVGPIIEYLYPTMHYKYYMYVEQDEYMSYVVPAYTIFALIVLFLIRNTRAINIPIEKLENYKQYGLFIFMVGVVFDILLPRLPGGLGFFAFLLSNFKFAGAIILFFSNDKRLKQIFYGCIVYLLGISIQNALFHDFVLWSVFFFMIWSLKFKPSKKTVLIVISIGLFSLTTLQTIKAVYRAQVWSGYSGNKLELFTSLLYQVIFSDVDNNNELDGEMNNVRLNQGWIISALMEQVPGRVSYAQGSTITEAISASLVPRFLNPNKKKAGGQENFERYTGLMLGENTSMGISIVGEAYINFGRIGGMLFMLLWGLFLAKVWVWLIKKLNGNILLLAFMPLLFLQVVKAETELVVVLNHLIKSMIVVFGFFWGARRFLNWNLRIETAS